MATDQGHGWPIRMDFPHGRRAERVVFDGESHVVTTVFAQNAGVIPYSSARALRTSPIKNLRLASGGATYVMNANE